MQDNDNPTAPPASPPPTAFPIVCIGASAGGVSAFEHFFRNASADSGMAFVVILHLATNRASNLTEILQRTTTMPVVKAVDSLQVMPNHVYVIPPNRYMTVVDDVLQLSLPELPNWQRKPIDVFLHSLAKDKGNQAIGIILSGTGSDGTLGLCTIFGAGGIAMVQEPATAEFDGMPTSAIQSGYATHVLPVEKMPEMLLTCKQNLGVLHQHQ